MNLRSPCALSLCLTLACASTMGNRRPPVDLVITHASVLDVRTGEVLPNRTILIDHGLIEVVTPGGQPLHRRAHRLLDAHGRLVTPGLVDVHSHSFLYLRDDAQLVMTPDSINAYRRVLASEYLPYGVTVVRDVGSSERVLPMLLAWTNPSPDAPDFYPSGAHLISPDPNWTPRSWQVVVADSSAAAAKVREYYGLGIRNIKLYWGLRVPEFKGALYQAQALGMNVTGHVDQGVMTIGQALDLGLRNVEHIHTFAWSVLTASDFGPFKDQLLRELGVTFDHLPPTASYFMAPELWAYLGPQNPRVLALVAKFKADDASLTPTLHVFAQRLGLTYFESAPRDSTEDTSVWTTHQREQVVAGYRVMASYVKRMYDDGIRLNLGTDARDPGKAALSEMLLLYEAGVPMTGVFKIATLDSAQDIGHGAEYGAIEVGRHADLIIFANNPLEDPQALLGAKTVIKDGIVCCLSD